MNFIEAVKYLQDGLCEGIRRISWPIDQEAFITSDVNGYLTFGRGYAFGVRMVLSDDWELVNPKPQMETVEVKRWLNLHTRSVQASAPLSMNNDWVELSGTCQREVKPKTKHREEIPDHAILPKAFGPDGVRYYREWEE